MGVSFTEYVNRMRIEYATMLINQHPDKSLTEVAEQAGFSGASSFYRNFRQFKGMGPREYQNNLNQ
jgi:transcriptional regulator GlxA family with amidase domain